VRVSAKGEYAIKAMLDLALCDDGLTLQPIQDIARRQGIPQRYLEQVLLGLKRAGFLHSRRGSAGDAGGDLIHLWRAMSDAVNSVVDATTLDDLRRQAVERRASTKPMYHI